jgi:HSP20 family molecular chaperone IbpA
MSAQVTVRDGNGSAVAAPRAYRTVAPAVDIYENADEIRVVADVPGVASEAIDVKVENDTLTIATKRAPASEERALGREYEVFDFARTFRLPRGIDGTNIGAEARDGTLVVRLPKAAASKPRKVAVSAS